MVDVLIDEIAAAWGWTGLVPEKVVAENEFGNLMVRDVQRRYWRICPEDLYCRLIAQDRPALDVLLEDDEFVADWQMERLVATARDHLGDLPEGRKYCLKIPSVLGGQYEIPNLATISLVDLMRASGHIAHEIDDLPDGAQVRLVVTD
ncbi:hypothetical protein IP84_10310 [beta proteobacterium AAP99]|nr:hypothetical protein IP84_10310 [beta proteobacterium AAP99]